MVALEISLLGTPTILLAGQPFDTDRRKAVALLAYLIVTGKPQPREQLAAFLWPDYDRESAFAYLRRTLFELNQGLGKTWLLTDRQSVGFVSSTGALIDTQIFERELGAARSADDPLPHLEAAAAQYKGEFLAGFFVQDTQPFEDWLRLQRESYRRDFATLLEWLVAIHEQRKAWQAALEHALAWLRLDDFNEAAHRALMRIYAGMGDRSRALRQYEICVQVLKDELKVKPLPETTALYDRIREGGFETVRQAEPPPPQVESPQNLHLPAQTTPFIGRRPEIEQVKELILNPDTRLLTLFGPGGMGKTRLSIQVASEISDHFPDGVWFVPLAAVQSTDGIIPEVAKSLNFSFHRTDETPEGQLVGYLRNKQLLLILDNVDQLASPHTANLLLEILTGAAAVKLLATSRVRLNLPAEQVFPLPGMRTPIPAEAAVWDEPEALAKPFSALQLFIDRAHRIQPNFQLNRENAVAVVEICQLVSGMPLGIELAASWLELLPPEEIRLEIQRSLDFLETDQPGVPDRQRSIRTIFDYSWKLLNEQEREIFLSLSVFIGGFTREAAQQVSGASLRSLLNLANKSWLQQVGGGRFQLHPLLQHYGLELLRQDEASWHTACDRHAAYYAGFVAELSQRLRGPGQLAAINQFSEEFATNIRAAWDWLVSAGSWAEIRQNMITGLFQFGMIHWLGDELIDWLRSARLQLEQTAGRADQLTLAIVGTMEINFEEGWAIKENQPEDRLASLWQMVSDHHLEEPMGFWFVLLGKLYVTRNRAPWAEERIISAVERIRDQGDAWWIGITLLIVSSFWGQFPTGRLMANLEQNLQEALGIFRKLDTVFEQGNILSIMAQDAIIKKRPLEDVVNLLQQAQQFYWKLNDRFGVGMVYWDIGNLYLLRGHPAEGFKAFHEMQRIFEQLGNQRMLVESLSWESLWATRYSTYEHALETRQRSLDLRRTVKAQSSYFWNIYELGEVHRIFGNPQKAMESYEEARLNFERINLVLGLGYYQRALGDLAMQPGSYADARRHYLAFQSYAEQDNHMWSMAQASLKLAWADAHLGEIDQSRSHISNGLNLLRNADEVGLELLALFDEALCLVEEAKLDSAVALAAYVAGHPMVWNECRELADALLSRLAENLDEATFHAAHNQLQECDIRDLTADWLAGYHRSLV